MLLTDSRVAKLKSDLEGCLTFSEIVCMRRIINLCLPWQLCTPEKHRPHTISVKSLMMMFKNNKICSVYSQTSWKEANKKQQEKLLELIRRLAEDDKEGVIAHKVMQKSPIKTFLLVCKTMRLPTMLLVSMRRGFV